MSDARIEAQRWRGIADSLAEALRALTEATGDESLLEAEAIWSSADDALEAHRDAVAQEDE